MGDMRRLQCKNIPDELVVEAVRQARPVMPSGPRLSWDVHDALEELVGEVPVNLFRAKIRKLVGRGLIGGCACGCRGDFHLPEECGSSVCCGPEA